MRRTTTLLVVFLLMGSLSTPAFADGQIPQVEAPNLADLQGWIEGLLTHWAAVIFGPGPDPHGPPQTDLFDGEPGLPDFGPVPDPYGLPQIGEPSASSALPDFGPAGDPHGLPRTEESGDESRLPDFGPVPDPHG